MTDPNAQPRPKLSAEGTFAAAQTRVQDAVSTPAIEHAPAPASALEEPSSDRTILPAPPMTIENAKAAIRGSRLPRRPRQIQSLGRVERALLDVVKERGAVRAFELHVEHGGVFKDPARILERLYKRGILARVERGVYSLAKPQRERIAEMREASRVIRQGASFVAPNGLTIPSETSLFPESTIDNRGKILKGAKVTFAPRVAVPGDIVIVDVGGLRTLRRFVGFDAPDKTRADKVRAVIVAHDTGTERVPLAENVTLSPVNGFFRRFTNSAAKARAEASDATDVPENGAVSGPSAKGVAPAPALAVAKE